MSRGLRARQRDLRSVLFFRRGRVVLGVLLILAGGGGALVWAGPPFLTDDPEPVPPKHWEFYGASQWTFARSAAVGTVPHLEVNYGAAPGLQLHVIVPAVLAETEGRAVEYGPGDVELGAKLRFIDETPGRPQVGTFPLLMLPTGSKARGLGAGGVEGLVPIWIQKSFDAYTTYGGAGVHLGSGSYDLVSGWLIQRAFGERIALGAEAYLTTPLAGSTRRQLQLNLGLIVNLTEHHHLLSSAGPAFGGDAVMQAYLAYQLTI